MKSGVASLALTLGLATGLATNAMAAPPPPKPISVDQSGSFLIDAATTEQLWTQNTPAKVKKLYPSKKFSFVSEVGGGFTESKNCVISARAMVLPVVHLPMQGRKIVYAPVKTSTAFDTAPNLSREQCQALARTKLKEAIQSLASALASS